MLQHLWGRLNLDAYGRICNDVSLQNSCESQSRVAFCAFIPDGQAGSLARTVLASIKQSAREQWLPLSGHCADPDSLPSPGRHFLFKTSSGSTPLFSSSSPGYPLTSGTVYTPPPRLLPRNTFSRKAFKLKKPSKYCSWKCAALSAIAAALLLAILLAYFIGEWGASWLLWGQQGREPGPLLSVQCACWLLKEVKVSDRREWIFLSWNF